MEVLKIVIEASKDHFGAYAENCEGVYGAGDSPNLAKENVLKAIELDKELDNTPVILQGAYEIEYRYDVESFLKYYEGIFSKSALERLTGINQKQLHHYASGSKKPREAQKHKLETALHDLGRELLAVKL